MVKWFMHLAANLGVTDLILHSSSLSEETLNEVSCLYMTYVDVTLNPSSLTFSPYFSGEIIQKWLMNSSVFLCVVGHGCDISGWHCHITV